MLKRKKKPVYEHGFVEFTEETDALGGRVLNGTSNHDALSLSDEFGLTVNGLAGDDVFTFVNFSGRLNMGEGEDGLLGIDIQAGTIIDLGADNDPDTVILLNSSPDVVFMNVGENDVIIV